MQMFMLICWSSNQSNTIKRTIITTSLITLIFNIKSNNKLTFSFNFHPIRPITPNSLINHNYTLLITVVNIFTAKLQSIDSWVIAWTLRLLILNLHTINIRILWAIYFYLASHHYCLRIFVILDQPIDLWLQNIKLMPLTAVSSPRPWGL